MITKSQYDALIHTQSVFGYASITREERFLLKKYQEFNPVMVDNNSKRRVFTNKLRRWCSDDFVPYKRRCSRRLDNPVVRKSPSSTGLNQVVEEGR